MFFRDPKPAFGEVNSGLQCLSALPGREHAFDESRRE
jgi:hypothetical protein